MYRGNRGLTKEYERERGEYNRAKKEMLKQHTKDFWEEQTRVENEWLEDYIKTQKEKKIRDDAKLRNSIITNSYICYENIKREIEEQQAFIAKQKLWREEDTQMMMEKHSIMTLLDRQADEDWLTPENVDTRLSYQLNQILPPTILSHVDYYKRLNTYAILMEQGYSQEAENIKFNKKVIDFKNKLLQPIYEELKTLIRHFTYTEEHSVHSLYKETILRIENYLKTAENEHELLNVKDNLNFLFRRLISLMRAENDKPDNKIDVIENQLRNLTMILVVWQKYTEIIYLPDADVEKRLDSKEKQKVDEEEIRTTQKPLEEIVEEKDPRVLKEYYFSKITEKRSKGSGLFINDIRGLYDDPVIRGMVDGQMSEENQENNLKSLLEDDEDFTSESEDEVDENKTGAENQGSLSGTSKDPSGKRKLLSNVKTKVKKSKRQEISESKKKLIESEVTEVFEDEWEEESKNISADLIKENEDESVENKEELKEELKEEIKEETDDEIQADDIPKLKDTSEDQIKATLTLKKEKKLLEEYMLMTIKNNAKKSKISKLDVHAEVQSAKKKLVEELGLNKEEDLFADIDKELKEVDLSKIIDLNDYEVELKKEQERLTLEKEFKNSPTEDLFKSRLFNTILKYSKDIFEFNQPKISTELDIYDENLIKFLECSVEESRTLHKSSSTSIIMEYIKEELQKINDESLSPTNKLKRRHLIKLADILARTRVPDTLNLKEVLDIFKHPMVKFD